MLTQLRRLYLLDAVLRDLGWFAANQLISPDGAKMVSFFILLFIFLFIYQSRYDTM